MSNDDLYRSFNKEKPMVMHIDLNSAFATTEQQHLVNAHRYQAALSRAGIR